MQQLDFGVPELAGGNLKLGPFLLPSSPASPVSPRFGNLDDTNGAVDDDCEREEDAFAIRQHVAD